MFNWLIKITQNIQTGGLEQAVAADNLKKVRKLLSYGVDPNIRCARFTLDEEPLLALALRTNEAVSLELLAHGARIAGRDKNGEPLLISAILHGQQLSAQKMIAQQNILMEASKQGESPLWLAAACGLEEVVNALILKQANLNEQAPDGTTPLMAVCRRMDNGFILHSGHKRRIMSRLVRAGADVNVQDAAGNTAIMRQIKQDSVDMIPLVEILLNGNPNLNIQNNNGDTALIMGVKTGNLSLVEILLAEGALVNVCNNNHESAFDVAKRCRNRNIILLLDRVANAQQIQKRMSAQKIKKASPPVYPAVENQKTRC